MGPNVIFDKSFLQSLNVDESVWFNHFFLSNICPLFYIETLADLDKKNNINRPADRVVGEIASKFPEGDAEAERNMIKETNDFASASTLCDNDIDFDISNPDAILIKRQVSKKKGSWYQLPRDIQ
jgi:hypothetical protein